MHEMLMETYKSEKISFLNSNECNESYHYKKLMRSIEQSVLFVFPPFLRT